MKSLLERLSAAAGEDAVVCLRILEIPALQTVLHGNYSASNPLLKTVFKRVLSELCDDACKGIRPKARDDDDARNLEALFRHVVACFHAHEHATHAEVRRWASLCVQLAKDEEAMAFLCRIFRGLSDPNARAVVHGTLSWTMSESCKCGHALMPFVSR